MVTLDIGGHLTPGVGLLAGRDRGKAVRAKAALDRLDGGSEPVRVIFPNFVYSINSSFFLGLFELSIDALGEDGFLKQYEFVGDLAQQACKDALRAYRIYRRPLRRPTRD